jgi:hypothetical protein
MWNVERVSLALACERRLEVQVLHKIKQSNEIGVGRPFQRTEEEDKNLATWMQPARV